MADLFRLFLSESIFFVSLVGLFLTSILLKRIPHYSSSDIKVLLTLTTLMMIIKGMENSGILQRISLRIQRGRYVSFKLILTTGILSMFVTNDIALLTIIPLTLMIKTERKDLLVILEILIANSFSALTPMGNPQNIFIYYHYHLHFLDFVKIIAPIMLLLSIPIFVMSLFIKTDQPDREEIVSSGTYWLFPALFVVFLGIVLKIIPFYTTVLLIAVSLLADKSTLKIDYFLIGTFFAFFGFTDNLMHIIQIHLNSPGDVFLNTVLLSQIISNVPATLLVADFTKNYRDLLLGANIGGFGTLLASFASIIGYKLYANRSNMRKFLLKFHILSFSFLAFGIILYFLIL